MVDVPELIGFVPVQKLLAVRRPCWAVAINAAIGSDARRFAAHLRARVQLILAGLIAKKRNGLSVWRPRRIEFMNAGSIGAQVADAAMLGGHGENVAARFDYGSGGGRRQREAANILLHALELGPGFQIFGVRLDRQVASFSALQVEFVKQAAVFVDDGVRAQAGPLDVVLFVVGELLGLFGGKIVAVKIHHAIAIADEIDSVRVPHGKHVHAGRLGQLFVGVFLQVINGDGQAPAAAITLPGAVLLRSFDVGDFAAVGRKTGEIAARNRQHLREAALGGDQIEARGATRGRYGAVGTEQNILTIGRPAEHDISGRMKREALGFAALGGDDVDIRIAVVGGREGDPFAVRRKFGVELVTSAGGDADRGAALSGSGPEIARVGEDDSVFRYVSVTEEAGSARGRLARHWHSAR